MKHENDVERYDWLHLSCKNLQFQERNKTIPVLSYIAFLFFKTENNIFIKKTKSYFPCLHSLVKISAKFVRTLTKFVKIPAKFVRTLDLRHLASWVFTDLLSSSPKRSPWFSPGYEVMKNMFYFLN